MTAATGHAIDDGVDSSEHGLLLLRELELMEGAGLPATAVIDAAAPTTSSGVSRPAATTAC